MSDIVYQREFPVAVPPPACTSKSYSAGPVDGVGSVLRYEDGGQSMQIEPWKETSDGLIEGDGLFVRVMSWHEGAYKMQPGAHPDMSKLLGKRVRVTVEILGDAE